MFAALLADLIRILKTESQPDKRIAPVLLNNQNRERVFIASMHWNDNFILSYYWRAAIIDLVNYLGAKNVYISIVENGSWDNTKDTLNSLDVTLGKLGVERSIEILNQTHQNQIKKRPHFNDSGWVWTRQRTKELRRIPYLADIRNRVMEKLNQLVEKDGRPNRVFDKVLWLNDIIFNAEDVATLMATRGGNYSAVCALDFQTRKLYDTFALRDFAGQKVASQTWPFFQNTESRQAMIENVPVRVQSCWNGMVVFDAAPFYENLTFQGIPDSLANYHLEASEGCTIHKDNPLSAQKGVWVNPQVRVAYNSAADKDIHPVSGVWPTPSEKVKGIWMNRFARWTLFPSRFIEQHVVEARVQRWQKKNHQEFDHSKKDCIVNDMQVITRNGWAHV